MQENSATVHYSGVPSLRRAFTTQMHYAENECAMPIRLHCNELRALCPTTNVLCRTAEFGALLLKCVLIVSIWSEKGVFAKNHRRYKDEKSLHLFCNANRHIFNWVRHKAIDLLWISDPVRPRFLGGRLLLQVWPDRFQIIAHFISAQAPISVNMVC